MSTVAIHKHARFEYEIVETFHAGIVLTGDEIKSIRRNGCSLKETFATILSGEAYIINWYISPYSHAYSKQTDDSRRNRKLLFNRKELSQLIGAVSRKGLTLIPLRIYFNERGLLKAEVGLARHKKLVDKRRDIKQRDLDREAQRDLKVRIT